MISFARFMELALYCPQLGYYERKKDTVGRRGDYYTSASVGPLFGELLAFQFADWLARCRMPDAGAGLWKLVSRRRLAADILRWLRGSGRNCLSVSNTLSLNLRATPRMAARTAFGIRATRWLALPIARPTGTWRSDFQQRTP